MVCSILGGLILDTQPTFVEGQTVRVKASILMKHIPKQKQGIDAKGMTGIVNRVYTEDHLSPITPVVVKFTEPYKWTGHFEACELEALEPDEV